MSAAENKAVFLSYASQDAPAVQRIAEALRANGVEVWFDQNELVGGDAWDAKIRKQIKECALFVPVISANTQARAEGYFRLEWKLAVDRSHLMADDAPFLFPVVIDDTTDAAARVPDKFREVQWTRLNVKDTPESLAMRVARILARAGSADEARAASRGESAGAGKRPHDPWIGRIAVGFGLLIALVAVLRPFWSMFRPRETPRLAAPARSAAPAPLSAARQLVAKARAMSLDKYDSTADDFATAEGLLKQAVALDQNDADVWAFSSVFNTSIRTRGFDLAPVRREMARRDAERALKLAPDSLEALYALGRAQRDFEPDAAEETFKKMLARNPDEFRALGNLASIYDYTGRPDEAVSLYERVAAADPAHEALTRYTEYLLFFHYGRFAEAERCIRRSVAIQPSANSQSGLAMLLLTWKGEAAEAARVLATGPTAARNEPRTIWTTAFVQLCCRAPDDTLKTLDRLADDFIQDNWFVGPKAYFAGRAHALAGRTEAARIAWESALAITNARLKDTPGDLALHVMRGQLLAFLGQTDEALREARAVAELARGNPRDERYWFISPALIYAALGRADDALPLLTTLSAPPAGQIVGWPLTPAVLRLDPLWDKIRRDPRFQALCAEPKKETSAAAAPPRDWPHDPELKRAVALLDGFDAIADDFMLAEEIAQRVVDKSPGDPEAVTALARVESAFLLRNFDFRDERSALAKRYCERAVQLAPDEPEALYSLAIYLVQRARDPARAESLLRRACELAPREPRYWRELSQAVTNQRPADGLALAEQNVARFPQDALTHYEVSIFYRNARRWADWERELDAALALAPIANAFDWKARAALMHGDLAAMRLWLERVPARLRVEERTVLTAVLYAAFSGDYDYGLKALQGFTGDWFLDTNNYSGPKALLTASLLEQQGKAEGARLQSEAALADVRRHQVANPADVSARIAEVWILRGLGRADEARVANRVYLEALRRPYRVFAMSNWLFDAIPANLLLGERTTAVQLIREAAEIPEGRNTIQVRLKLDPRMAPWRDDAEIVALLAAPASAEPKK